MNTDFSIIQRLMDWLVDFPSFFLFPLYFGLQHFPEKADSENPFSSFSCCSLKVSAGTNAEPLTTNSEAHQPSSVKSGFRQGSHASSRIRISSKVSLQPSLHCYWCCDWLLRSRDTHNILQNLGTFPQRPIPTLQKSRGGGADGAAMLPGHFCCLVPVMYHPTQVTSHRYSWVKEGQESEAAKSQYWKSVT